MDMKMKKFATQVDEDVLEELRRYVKASDRSISGVVTDAIRDYINRLEVRPAFRDSMDEVLSEHSELLKRLAK